MRSRIARTDTPNDPPDAVAQRCSPRHREESHQREDRREAKRAWLTVRDANPNKSRTDYPLGQFVDDLKLARKYAPAVSG